MIRKLFQNIYKKIIYSIFKIFHGNIKGVIKLESENEIVKVSKDKKINYSIYFCNKSRLYTDTIHDTAFIRENFLIDGPSFQFRNNKIAKSDNNIVLKKGTPRLKKIIKGKVFSLLTGGGGNTNYYHWLFDVLPRLEILKEKINLKNVDYFLFPRIDLRFQKETLDLLNIPSSKRLSSQSLRHFYADQIIAVDHPCFILNDPSKDPENTPDWIINFYKNDIKSKIDLKQKFKKIFIDREDSRSNIKDLRKIINDKEVKEFLVSRGFEPVKLSSYSFIDQISIFHSAEIIVGLHGAGFSNLLFCKPDTRVIEIKPSHFGNMYQKLGEKVGVNYVNLTSKTQGESYDFPNQLGSIIVNLNELKETVK
tara:strand:- start:65 stop:1159 length:1095 start_codon:yes stop_codon:yes gene_type:complete